MATIITKNSQTASAVPSAASLSVGELAVNTADGKLYTEHTGGVVKEIIPSTVVDGGITPAKLSTGAPTWNTAGTLIVNGASLDTVRFAASQPLINFSGTYNSGNGFQLWQSTDGTVRFNVNGSLNALTLDTSSNLRFNSGYGSVATAYGCRAWVNFNGTGSITVRASGNVSSITDLGTGYYQVNFTTAMPDVNYAVTSSWDGTVGGGGWTVLPETIAVNTGNCSILWRNPATSPNADPTIATVMFVR